MVQRCRSGSRAVSSSTSSIAKRTITDEPNGHAARSRRRRYFYDEKSRRWMLAYPEGDTDGKPSRPPLPTFPEDHRRIADAAEWRALHDLHHPAVGDALCPGPDRGGNTYTMSSRDGGAGARRHRSGGEGRRAASRGAGLQAAIARRPASRASPPAIRRRRSSLRGAKRRSNPEFRSPNWIASLAFAMTRPPPSPLPAGGEAAPKARERAHPEPSTTLSQGQRTILEPVADDVDLLAPIDQRRKRAAQMRLH